MTSAITNAPNIGFTQAGGFMGVTVRNNPDGRMVRTRGRLRVFGDADVHAQHCVDHEWHADRRLHSEQHEHKPDSQERSRTVPSSNFVKPGGRELHVQSDNDRNADDPANNHPTLTLNGYVGGVMVTANGGAQGAPANFTKPYVITNLTEQPGDVSIFLPGNSSEMLAIFNVGSVGAPSERHDEFQLYLRKRERERPDRAEQSARRLRQSLEFRGAGRRRYSTTGPIFLSRLRNDDQSAAFDRRLRQSAVGDG